MHKYVPSLGPRSALRSSPQVMRVHMQPRHMAPRRSVPGGRSSHRLVVQARAHPWCSPLGPAARGHTWVAHRHGRGRPAQGAQRPPGAQCSVHAPWLQARNGLLGRNLIASPCRLWTSEQRPQSPTVGRRRQVPKRTRAWANVGCGMPASEHCTSSADSAKRAPGGWHDFCTTASLGSERGRRRAWSLKPPRRGTRPRSTCRTSSGGLARAFSSPWMERSTRRNISRRTQSASYESPLRIVRRQICQRSAIMLQTSLWGCMLDLPAPQAVAAIACPRCVSF